MPATTSQAQYSLPFALAVMLVHGRIGPNDITGARLNDPQVSALLPRISVHEAAKHSERFPEGRWSDVTVELKDGRRLASGDVNARGGPEAPMDMHEVEAKFHIMAAALSGARRRAIWEMCEQLMQPEAKFEELARLVCAPMEEPHA